MINEKEKYSGHHSAAIAFFNGGYLVETETDAKKLDKHLEYATRKLKGKYLVLVKFYGIDYTALDIIFNAARRLNSGENVNLEKLLD